MSFDITSPSVDANFPGGNILVQRVDGNTFFLQPDMRDTQGWWFYWCFRVRAAAGQQIVFAMDPKNIGVLGPAISLDKGVSWSWFGMDAVNEGRFSCNFPMDTEEVRFSFGMPYLQSNLDCFLLTHPELQVDTLVCSPQGRKVPMIQIRSRSVAAPYAVAITVRHHCCEMMASYVLEGMIEAILDQGEGELAGWLRENVDFLFIPFMDLDGVEAGDQGKNRIPHDHNRDYTDSPLYPEVAAFQKLLPQWSGGRPLLAFDLHCPYIRGDVSELLHFLEPQRRDQAEWLAVFCDIMEQNQRGSIRYRKSDNLLYGQGYNVLPADQKKTTCSGWIRSLPNNILATTMEIPYANAGGCEVNATSARAVGRDLAVACSMFLRTVRTV